MSRETPIKAMQMALGAHQGQMYGHHSYDYHLNSVVIKCNELYGNCDSAENLIAVAWLHDILEDTDVSAAALSFKFESGIVNAVVSVSKIKGENYSKYIDRVKGNRLSLKVKIADTLCNLEESIKIQDQRRIKKYTKQLQLLTE